MITDPLISKQGAPIKKFGMVTRNIGVTHLNLVIMILS